jgi:dihydrolipoamide dehydrogenase
MSQTREVTVPDIGDFEDVPVIELLVAEGDEVALEDPLVVLESDKATMEVPSTVAGTIQALKVAVGDTVAEGTVIAVVETADAEDGAGGDDAGSDAAKPEAIERAQAAPTTGDAAPTSGGDAAAEDAPKERPAAGKAPRRAETHGEVVVLGSGVGGYTAAFRAADLGLDVVLVTRDERLGGVCLNVGCIPSKALLHAAKVLTDAQGAAEHGIAFGEPEVDLDALRGWKDGIVERLTGGLAQMAKAREVRVVTGEARVTEEHALDVGGTEVTFDHLIVATGSRPIALPDLPDDERIIDSTGALELADVPERLLVIGGGIIGLEMATVYDALGAAVTVVEMADQLIPGADKDLVKPLQKRIEERYDAIHLSTRVTSVEAGEDGVAVRWERGDEEDGGTFDRVLVAVGRAPNGRGLGLEEIGVEVDERGFVPVDDQLRTKVPHVFAIGDVVGQPMLAHKAAHEGKVAAEVIAGEDVAFDARGIPSVAYTDPEVAWVGLTETQAKAEGRAVEVGLFPWSASGRALSTGSPSGRTKLLVDPESRRVLGAGIVGANAGELIAEPGFALEMGAEAGDLGLTVHAHPTLSETVAFAAEVAEGTLTDLPPKRKRRR